MFLQINDIITHKNGRIEMLLEFDESFRQRVASHFNKTAVTKKEMYKFILEKLESMIQQDATLIAELNDSKFADE